MTEETKKGVLRVQKLLVKQLDTKNVRIEPGTFNTGTSGISKGGLIVYQDFESVTKPQIGSCILNSLINSDTGGEVEIWGMQATSQTVPNSRYQTWNANEWIRIIPNYKNYVISGTISGRVLTLVRGEGLGNVEINNLALDQKVAIHDDVSNHFTVTKTGGGTNNADANAIIETYQIGIGNVWLNAQNNKTLKKNNNGSLKSSFEFKDDTFLMLADTPNTFSSMMCSTLQVNSTANAMIFGVRMQNDDTNNTIKLGTYSPTIHNKLGSILLGYNTGDNEHSSIKANNVIIGNSSMNSLGSYNTCIGGHSLFSLDPNNVTYNHNVCIGFSAMNHATSSARNIAIGNYSGHGCSSSDCIWLGHHTALNSAVDNQLMIGNLLVGTMTNADSTSSIHIGAKKITLPSSIPTSPADISHNQIWNDHGVLKFGNVISGSSYDITGGFINHTGNLVLKTRSNDVANLTLSGNVFKGTCTSGSIIDKTLTLQLEDSNDIVIDDVLSTDYKLVHGTIDVTGNIQINTMSSSLSNISVVGNAHKYRITDGTIADTVLTINRKNASSITVSNVVSDGYLLSHGTINSSGDISVQHNNPSISNITITGNVYQNNMQNLQLTNNTLALSNDTTSFSVNGFVNASHTITSAIIDEHGNINLITAGANTANVNCNVNLYRDVVTNLQLNENSLILQKKSLSNINISNIASSSTNIYGGVVSDNGILTLFTNGHDTSNIHISSVNKSIVTGGNIQSANLVLSRNSDTNVIIPITSSVSTVVNDTTNNLPIIPDIYKKADFSVPPYRYTHINVNAGPNFCDGNPNVVLNGTLSGTGGKFADYVVFEFTSTPEYNGTSYVLNEIIFLIDESMNSFSNDDLLFGIIQVEGKISTQWHRLNKPRGLIYDIYNQVTMPNNITRITLRMIQTISQYTHYRISFSNFAVNNSPTILEIEFDHTDAHFFDYIPHQWWYPPTGVLSFTNADDNLPHMLVLNYPSTLVFTLDSVEKLHSSDPLRLVYNITVTTFSTTSTINKSNMVIDPDMRTVQFPFVATTDEDHTFTLELWNTDGSKLSTQYQGFVPGQGLGSTSSILQFPNLTSTVKTSPYDTTDITVGQTLNVVSTFDGHIDPSVNVTVTITDNTSHTPNVHSVSVSGSNLSYSFTVTNDADHSGVITFVYGSISHNYSWSANGILTATNDIYSFPNYFTFDGSSVNGGMPSGSHLTMGEQSNLLLTFVGGDHLHSDTYSSQVSSVSYKVGNNGTLTNISSSDVTINSASGHESILLSNIVASEVNDVYIYISLIAPDSTISSQLQATVPSSAIQVTGTAWAWPAGNNGAPYWQNISDSPWRFSGHGLWNTTARDAYIEAYDPNMYFVMEWWMLNVRPFPSDLVDGWGYYPTHTPLPYGVVGGPQLVRNSNGHFFNYGIHESAQHFIFKTHSSNNPVNGASVAAAVHFPSEPPFTFWCQGYNYPNYVSRYWQNATVNANYPMNTAITMSIYGYQSSYLLGQDNADGHNRVTTNGTLLLDNVNCRANSSTWITLSNPGYYSHFRIEYFSNGQNITNWTIFGYVTWGVFGS